MSQEAAPAAAPKKGGRRRTPAAQVGPGTDVGSYVVEAQLGEGGYGTVFLAWRGGKPYALKVLPLAEVGASAIQEVLALSRVSHPHVVHLHGFWQWPDVQPRYLVVVMEYVQGPQLDAWTQAQNPSALGVLRVVLGVARALEAVHQAGLLHLDVKEANIIVRQADGEAVLVDFGVSAAESSSPTSGAGLPQGTPHYLSPEAWRFKRERRARGLSRYRPTAADDVYALGLVLYWLLTGRMPFYPDDTPGVDKVLGAALVPPHEHNPRVPLELSALCVRLLDRQPEARPTAGVVAQAVEELLTQRGAAWEQPLCDGFNEHTVTTRPGPDADEEAAWLKDMEGGPNKPRRGPRPPTAVEAAPPSQVPVASVGGEPRKPAWGRRPSAVAVLVLVAGLSVAAWWLGAAELEAARPTWQIGRKVAPAVKPMEGAPATDELEVSVDTSQKKQPQRLAAVKKAAALAATCTTLACTGPETHVLPPAMTAEPCPPGSLETMEQLGISIGDRADAVFTWHKPGEEPNVQVSEGWTTVKTVEDLGKLEAPTILTGRIILTEKRAYGHFTQATFKGKNYPVCFNWTDGDRSDEGTVESTVAVKAVREFK
jgi:hypothetical protein